LSSVEKVHRQTTEAGKTVSNKDPKEIHVTDDDVNLDEKVEMEPNTADKGRHHGGRSQEEKIQGLHDKKKEAK
jgi:hypothetical protein